MNFAKLLSIWAMFATGTLATTNSAVNLPVQQFIIPLPEDMVYFNTFKAINRNRVSGQVMSTISLSIGNDHTVIWYDNWEDGYETDVTSMTILDTTEVWGDGIASNGCAPIVATCTNATDVLRAGDVILLENFVDPTTSRNLADIKYDGRDIVYASLPIAITRGEYPESPGSLLVGAVEVLETSKWGTYYESPIGQDMTAIEYLGAFEYVGMYVLAGSDNTNLILTDKNGNILQTGTLQKGESIEYLVNVADSLTATKNVQVDILAGDRDSRYEMRWYTLLPTEDWSNEYLAPVGDDVGNTTCVIYNPSENDITVSYQFGDLGATQSLFVAAKSTARTEPIPSDTAAYLTSPTPVMVFSMTDTVESGMLYDWGFPVQPVSSLTSQVLVGWGHGCTANDCGTGESRSVVWISAMEDAILYIDYTNDGIADETRSIRKFESVKVVDIDHDMSGAKIKARDPQGNSVKISVAWGQDPSRSFNNDKRALDLGTAVLPYPEVRVTECIILIEDSDGSGDISEGDTCQKIERTQNLDEDPFANLGPRGDFEDFVETIPCPTDGNSLSGCQEIMLESDPLPGGGGGDTTTVTSTTEAPPSTTTTEIAPTTTTTFSSPLGGGGGDPHFQRWGQERNSFHGECDLVAIHSDAFQGIGLDLHVRTTIFDWYSYIEMAALRIGEDVIELQSQFLMVNGLKIDDKSLPVTFGNEYRIDFEKEISKRNVDINKKLYKISLGDDSTIVFRFYKHFLTFQIEGHSNDFGDANGLLGSHPNGEMVTRDGKVIDNFWEFGFEWQVNPTDPVLFKDHRSPQLPFEQCRIPTSGRPSRQRQLRGNEKLHKEAVAACSTHKGNDFELCVSDVMATGDLELAYMW